MIQKECDGDQNRWRNEMGCGTTSSCQEHVSSGKGSMKYSDWSVTLQPDGSGDNDVLLRMRRSV